MVSFERERGAVSIVFLVLVLIVTVVFGALWFVEKQENKKLMDSERLAAAAKSDKDREVTFCREYYATVAEKVGGGVEPLIPAWTPDIISGRDIAATPVKKLDELITNVPLRADDNVTKPATLADAVEAPIKRYQTLKGEITQNKAEIERLKKDVEEKDKTIAANQKAYDEARRNFQTEAESTYSRLNTQLNETRAQNEQVQTQIRDANAETEKVRTESNAEKQKILGSQRELEGQVRQIHGELKIKRATETPDGKILNADPNSSIVMIDVTSQSQLRRGTRFKVYETGKGNTKIHKGWITVTDVGPSMSEARIEETMPGVGGIGRGDWIYNPFFDKETAKTGSPTRFVFLGQLPGRYTREMATRILESFGARVEDKVTVHTSFLVLGAKEDPEGPELTEDQNYKNATLWGVEIIRAQDLAPFLQM
jgi:hypothetical protein